MTTLTNDVITVKINGISNEIEAKIDTGAGQSSLHAEDIQVTDDQVIFRLGDRVYRAPLETSQDISSADGGTSSRPVISATIEIEGQSINTLLNLNDRSEMPQKLLIGQDVIRAGEFVLKFTEEGSSEQPQENEEVVNGEQPQQPAEEQLPVSQTEPGPPSVPVVNMGHQQLPEKMFELIDQIVDLSNHVQQMEVALNDLRVKAIRMLKDVGFPSKPVSVEVEDQQ